RHPRDAALRPAYRARPRAALRVRRAARRVRPDWPGPAVRSLRAGADRQTLVRRRITAARRAGTLKAPPRELRTRRAKVTPFARRSTQPLGWLLKRAAGDFQPIEEKSLPRQQELRAVVGQHRPVGRDALEAHALGERVPLTEL